MPKAWYNIQADLLTPEDLAPLFPELIKQKVRSDRLNARRKILIENPDLGSLGIAIALAPFDRKRFHIIELMPIGKTRSRSVTGGVITVTSSCYRTSL